MHSLKKLALICIASIGLNTYATKEDDFAQVDKGIQTLHFVAGYGLVGAGAYNWGLFNNHLVDKNKVFLTSTSLAGNNYRNFLHPDYKPAFPGSRILAFASKGSVGLSALTFYGKALNGDLDPEGLSATSRAMGIVCAANLATMGRQLQHVIPIGKEIFALRLKANGLGVIGWNLIASYYDNLNAIKEEKKKSSKW